MPENRYLQYLIDPTYNEDYGVSPPPSRLLFAGAAAGAALLFLRTPAGHAALKSILPRAKGQSLLERKVLELYYARNALSNIVRRRIKNPDAARRIVRAHANILNRETADFLERRGRSLASRILGARPVTVGDILDRRVPFEYRTFRLVVPPLGEDLASIGFAEEAPPGLMEKLIRDWVKEYPDVRNVPVDPGLLINRRGEVIDLRGFNELVRRLTSRLSDLNIPIVNWNIGQILRLDLIREVRERPQFAFIPWGSVQPFLGGPVKEDLLLLGRKLVPLRDPSRVVAEGVYIAPFGTPLRAAALIQQISGEPAYRTGFHRLLDLGAQSERSWTEAIASIFRPKHPLDIRSLSRNLLAGVQVEGSARKLIEILESEPMPLSKEIWESPAMRQAIQKVYGNLFPEGRIPLDTRDDLIRTLYYLITSDKLSRRYGGLIQSEWKALSQFPDVYFRRLHFSRERFPQLPYLNLEQVIATPQEQRLRHLIQQEVRSYIRQKTGSVPFDLMSEEALRHPALRRMVLIEELRAARSAGELLERFRSESEASLRLRKLLERTVREMAPWYAPSFDPRSPARTMAQRARGGLLMREWFRPPSFSEILEAARGDREAVRRILEQGQRFFRQFFAGRHDREHFTTATLFPYYSMLRLNDMFAMFGLGLSERSMGSTQQIFLNLLFRRYLAAIALFGYAGYLSWEVENLTGFSPKRAFFDMLAGANIAWASLMNATGVTDLTRRMAEVMPGSELVWELPVLSFFDPRWEAEELAEFLREGTAPVRRGRWWQYSGPIQGGPILYYWPSWYRRFTADWEFTPILWGEREDAYAHWWLPTPRYPLSPIRHFITDPYYLESMWGRHRPYPITGPIPAFSNVPVFGPLLNATVGRLLKPPVSLYEEEMAAWAQGVPYGLSGLGSQLSGAVPIVQVTPAGLVRLGLRTEGLDLSAVSGQGEQPAEAGASPAQGKPRAFGPAFLTAMDRLAGIHQSILAEGEARAIPAGPSPSQAGMAAFDQVLPAGEPAGTAGQGPSLLSALGRIAGIHQGILAEDQIRSVTIRNRRPLEFGLSQALPPASLPGGDALRFQLAESFSQTTDILGLYGFLLRSALGVADRPWEDAPRLATPERVTSLGRWHAELQIGGFPGELSEVGRRFLPTYRRYDPEVEVNPLRNLMPSWLPGENYFIDFRTGDPYCVSPDTLIETGQGSFMRADEVIPGTLIRTHKGRLIPVEKVAWRKVAPGEKVFRFTVATLPSFPFTVSEEHPLLVVDSPQQRRAGYRVRIAAYALANDVLKAYADGFSGSKQELASLLGQRPSAISKALSILEKDGKIRRNGRRSVPTVVDPTPYDLDIMRKGLAWKTAEETEIGDYVAYPLPVPGNDRPVLDLAEILADRGYVFTDKYCYYTVPGKQHAEIYEFLEANPGITFQWGERKKLLEERGWSANVYEHIQGEIRQGWGPKRIPRYIPVNESFMALAGYYVAEGSCDLDTGAVKFDFHRDEVEYHEELIGVIRELTRREPHLRYHRKGSGVSIQIGLRPLAELLTVLFGNSAYTKRVPDWFFTLDPSLIAVFLRTLISGDGAWFQSGNRPRVTLKTASPTLAFQVRLLALVHRIVGSIIAHPGGRTEIQSGEKAGLVFNQAPSYSVNFNGAEAIKLAELCGFTGLTRSKDNGPTTWFMDEDYLYLRVNSKEEVENVTEVIGFQVDVDDSFCVLGVATHNTKIPHGEYRLPGPGYERMHGIPPLEERLEAMFPDPNVRSVVQSLIEQGYISPYETYSAWERFKILADVAPWSEEYKYYEKLLTDNKELIPPTKLAEFQRIKKQVSQVKKRERFFPYRFRYADLEYHSVTVQRVLNNNVFLVAEFDQPIRLAGVYVPQGQDEAGERARRELSRFLYPGARITIGIAQDPLRRTGSDQLESIRAVVITDGMQLNRYLLEQGIARERPAEDPASIHVRFSPAEILIGSLWERFAHLDTPIHTALLQVRSPLEMYERKEVFGKAWRPWWEPVSSILVPTVESLARHSPLVSAGYGYVYGRLATLMSRDRAFKHRAGLWGAGIMAGLSVLRMLYEARTGEAWIPRRRRLEREVELYFSALEYLRYRGIYEFARRRALEEEGFDVARLYEEAEQQGRHVKRLRRELEALKRELIIEGPSISEERLSEIHARIQMMSQAPVEPGHQALLRAINERLRALGELRQEEALGPWAQLAIEARERYESTIWGMDPYGHLEQIIRGLPRKDRIYITEFLKAPEPERERILKIAPVYVRRVLQARWGMEPEPLPDLAEFFSQYWLPPIESGVWSPAKNLEDLKVKVVESLGLELTEFGLWKQDVRRAEENQAPLIPWNVPNAQGADLERKLRAIMEGQGLEDVWVRISPSQRQGIHMMLNITRDPTEELRAFLLNNPYAVFGR